MTLALMVTDVMDIAVLSLLAYALISVLRRAASARLIIASLVLLGVYLLARTMDLRVTEMVMRASALVALIVLVVAFQAEFRRIVHQLGGWRSQHRGVRAARTVEQLTEAVSHMAEHKVGALIVLGGRDNWLEHVEGGIALDGRLSMPLLYSIFSTDSAGHDGAVILQGDRLVRFAAHLPLSINREQIGSHGTRHAAALGLSEQCDALVVAVSEETGGVSIAQAGRLDGVSVAELEDRLERFWERHHGRRALGPAHWLMHHGVQNAVLAAGLAALLWVQFAVREPIVSQTYTLPIRLQNLEPTWWLREPVPNEANVTLSGPAQALRGLDERSTVIELDMGRLETGRNAFTVARDNLKLPEHLELKQVNPQPIVIYAERFRPVALPVRVERRGALPEGVELVSLEASPATIVLYLPDGVAAPTHVPTEPIDLTGISTDAQVQTRIILPPKSRLPAKQSGQITVDVVVKARPASGE